MTVVCKVKDRIVDLETWVNNAEFDDKVNRIKRKIADYAEKFDCELECVDGNVVCHVAGGYTITAFGYGSKYTIILKKGKKIIIDRFCEFDPIIDNMFDNDISHVFKILHQKMHYSSVKPVLDGVHDIFNVKPTVSFNGNTLIAIYSIDKDCSIIIQHKGDGDLDASQFTVTGTDSVHIAKVRNFVEVEVN